MRLSWAQLGVLRRYSEVGVPTTAAFGRISTWKTLRGLGLITCSAGPGPIETEVSEAGAEVLRREGLLEGQPGPGQPLKERTMDKKRLIEGLKALSAPDQGMSYHSGGPRRGGPRYDDQTGRPLAPDFRPAELTVYGDRAKFLYELIQDSDELAEILATLQ